VRVTRTPIPPQDLLRENYGGGLGADLLVLLRQSAEALWAPPREAGGATAEDYLALSDAQLARFFELVKAAGVLMAEAEALLEPHREAAALKARHDRDFARDARRARRRVEAEETAEEAARAEAALRAEQQRWVELRGRLLAQFEKPDDGREG
jgi:hypothetical protein